MNIPGKTKAAGVVADNSGMKDTIAQSASAPAAEPLPGARRRENRIRVNIPTRIIYQGLLHEFSADAVCTAHRKWHQFPDIGRFVCWRSRGGEIPTRLLRPSASR